MSAIDVFSAYDAGHPVAGAGKIQYLLAPPARGVDSEPASLETPADFRQHVARFDRAVGGLLPVLGTAEQLLAEALDDSWWRGLLLSPPAGAKPHGGLFDEQIFDTLSWPEAEELPIVIDCGLEGFSRPGHLKAFLERCPPRPTVLTHGGQLNISGGHLESAAELFRLYPHTLLETSGIYRQDFLEGMFRDLGARRILYGSGYPRMDERLELERVAILPASEAELGAMFEGNARRVFGLPV